MTELQPDEVRDCQEIARRSRALFGVVGIALGAPRSDIIDWLEDEALWDDLSPEELTYAMAQEPTEKESINASWRSEALIVLLWALRKVEKLPAPNEQCDTSIFQELLPPFADISVEQFVASAECRSEKVLQDMADELMALLPAV
jgi:hypothetical protein